MSGQNPGDSGWFRYGDPHDAESAATAIRDRTAEQPQNWPAEAVRAGFVEDEDEYFDALHDATVHATRAAVQARETADDQQLQYSIAAMDDAERTANEIAERVVEWAGSLADGRSDDDRAPDIPGGVDGARAVAAWTP